MALWTREKTQDELDILNKHTRWMRWGVYLLILYIIFSDLLINTINAPDVVVDYTKNPNEELLMDGAGSNKTDAVDGIDIEEETVKSISPYHSTILEGKGVPAICGDSANISYKIILYDGTIFIENEAVLEIGKGKNNLFEQSVDGMKLGGIRQVVLPSEYSERFEIKDNVDQNIAMVIELNKLDKAKASVNNGNCKIKSFWKNNIF